MKRNAVLSNAGGSEIMKAVKTAKSIPIFKPTPIARGRPYK
jgi:hypothetical protein